MPTRRRTFKLGTDINKYDPLEFELNDKVFSCKPAIQGYVLLDFVARSESEDGDSAGAVYDFFKTVMTPEEYVKLQDYLQNDDVIIDLGELTEIIGWLVEQYTQRPTQLPEESSSGQSTSTPMSTEQPSSEAAVSQT